MALFDSRARKLLKNLQKMASENMIDQAALKVEKDYRVIVEDRDVSRELLSFLLDIGYPDLAARISEEIIRIHKDLRDVIIRHLEDRFRDFPNSLELLRSLWNNRTQKLDFSGAILLTENIDRTTEQKLFDSIEKAAKSSRQYSLEDKMLPGDVEKFISYGLSLVSKGRNREALEILSEISGNIDSMDKRIPRLIDWMSLRKGTRDPEATLFLIRTYAAMNSIQDALNVIPVMFKAPENLVSATISVIEKDILPNDLSHKSRIYLAKLHAIDGRYNDASRILEQLIVDGHTGKEVADTVDFLSLTAEGYSRPLLVHARFKSVNGEITAAIDSIEKAFRCEDIQDSPITEICRSFLEEGIDREWLIAKGLASFLTDYGSVAEAVESLGTIVTVDTEWVIEKLQLLISRNIQSADVLTLIGISMMIQGRDADARRTLKHLMDRKDRRSQEDMLLVLDRFDHIMNDYPRLRNIRASVRWSAGHKEDAATDYLFIFISGKRIHQKIFHEIINFDLHHKYAREIVEAKREPDTPLEAFIIAGASINQEKMDSASKWLSIAVRDHSLSSNIANEISGLSADVLNLLDLSGILPGLAKTGSAKEVSRILLKTKGKDEWRVSLIASLSFGSPAEEAEFRLRSLIPEGLLALAGSSISELSLDDETMRSIARSAELFGMKDIENGLKIVENTITDTRFTHLVRDMLTFVVDENPHKRSKILTLISKTFISDGEIHEAVSILESIQPVTDEIIDLLSHIVTGEEPEPRALLLLTRTMLERENEEKFRKYSSMLLDINPEEADNIRKMSIILAEKKGSAELLVYAARIIDRFGLLESSEKLLIDAINLNPDIASALVDNNRSPGFVALCHITAGDASGFSELATTSQNLKAPMNDEILNRVLAIWKPGKHDRALWYLADVAGNSGMYKCKIAILSDIAINNKGTWGRNSSEELLKESAESSEAAVAFWESVQLEDIFEKGMTVIDPQTVISKSVDELLAITEAALRVDQILPVVRNIFNILIEKRITEHPAFSKRMAKVCFEFWEKENSIMKPGKLLTVLLGEGLLTEVSRLGISIGNDKILASLRSGLEKVRAKKIYEEKSVFHKARSLLDLGDIDNCLAELDKQHKTIGELDLFATAYWRNGLRNLAIELWIKCYMNTKNALFLQKAYWACGKAGFPNGQAGIRRVFSSRHPGLFNKMEKIEEPAMNLRVIG